MWRVPVRGKRRLGATSRAFYECKTDLVISLLLWLTRFFTTVQLEWWANGRLETGNSKERKGEKGRQRLGDTKKKEGTKLEHHVAGWKSRLKRDKKGLAGPAGLEGNCEKKADGEKWKKKNRKEKGKKKGHRYTNASTAPPELPAASIFCTSIAQRRAPRGKKILTWSFCLPSSIR
jgi:hypothetical protein